jgi:urea transport system permease protein
VVIVGGIGQLRGVVIAAVALGIINSYVEYATSPTLGKAALFLFVIALLQFRPNGLVSFRSRGLTS